MFSVNANLFRIAATFISKEETRYYLKGVQIERHPVRGAVLVATDGHRAFAAHDEEAILTPEFPEHGVIVKLDTTALKACKADRRETSDRRLIANSSDTSQPLVISNGAPVALALDWRIDGSFPDWRRIVPNPSFDPSASVAFNTAYLDTFGKAAKELGHSAPVVAVTGPNDGPLLVTFNDNRAFGVIMPVRWNGETSTPLWLHETPAQAAK